MRPPRLLALTLLLVGAITVACDNQPGTPAELRDPNLETTDSRALDAARVLWAAGGTTNYDMRFNWTCFCPPERTATLDLEIRGDTISGRTPADGETVSILSHQRIEDLFALIEDAINQRAAAINVTYHSTLGYPLTAYIDYDLKIADEELGFTIHQLTLR